MQFPRSILGPTLFLALASATAAAQTTWYVDASGAPPGTGSASNPYTSIQYAISRPTTVSGDEQFVMPGTYAEQVRFLGKLIRVASTAGAGATRIDAGHSGSAVSFVNGETAEARLEGFTLAGGSGTYLASAGTRVGGGILCLGTSPWIASCTLRDNSVQSSGGPTAPDGQGGGIYCGAGAAPVLSGCTIQSNSAERGGGAFVHGSSLVLLDSWVMDNLARVGAEPGSGGGICATAGAYLELQGGGVSGNLAVGTFDTFPCARGGGIRIDATCRALIDSTVITSNEAGGIGQGYCYCFGEGGAVWSAAAVSDVLIRNVQILGNWAEISGGGVHGSATLTACVIEGNHGQRGGGVFALDATLEHCSLRNNRGSSGSDVDSGTGIYVEGTGVLSNCEISGNVVIGEGGGGVGGIYSSCDIHDNVAYAPDFGIALAGGVSGGVLVDCRIWNNRVLASDMPAWGGGIDGGSAERCVFWNNSAPLGGAASYAQLTNCTLYGNSTTGGGLDGGVNSGSVSNSIVWGNLPGNIDGAFVAWSDVGGGYPGVGNIDADPQFWDAPAAKFHLRAASPCIDAGDPASPPDPDGSRVDMGALPYDPTLCGQPDVYCTAKVNSLGCTPAIGTNGQIPSIASGTFAVTATNVINKKNGLLFWSTTAAAVPFQDGTLCVSQPFIRTAVQSSGGSASGSDCTGAYSFTWTGAYVAAQGLTVGDRVLCQYWSRDPASASTTGLTDAVDFSFCP